METIRDLPSLGKLMGMSRAMRDNLGSVSLYVFEDGAEVIARNFSPESDWETVAIPFSFREIGKGVAVFNRLKESLLR